MTKDYYAILGLLPGASQDEVIEAFFRLSQKHFPQTESSAVARVEMHDIAEAWQVLSDHRQREAYDAQLRHKRYGVFARLVRAPRRAQSEIKQSLRITGREIGERRGNLLLLALTAVLLVFIYGIGPQDRQKAQAKADDSLTMNVASVGFQQQDVMGPFYPTASPAPVTPTRTPTRMPTRMPTRTATVALTSAPTATSIHAITEQTAVSDDAQSVSPELPAGIAAFTPTRTRVPATRTAATATATKMRPTQPAIATAAGFKYPAPQPILPGDGTRYFCGHSLVFEWGKPQWVNLGADEWFVLEARAESGTEWNGLSEWTHEQTVSLNPNKKGKDCDIPWLPAGRFEWRVRIVQGDRNTHTIERVLNWPGTTFFVNHEN